MLEEKDYKVANCDIPSLPDLSEILLEKVAIVTFKKLDGSNRVMTCTKSLNVIPKEHHPKTNKEPAPNTVNVWDLNAKGWRSFKYDRINNIVFEDDK